MCKKAEKITGCRRKGSTEIRGDAFDLYSYAEEIRSGRFLS